MGERIEPLGAGFGVCVSDNVGFTTDSVLLADFSSPKRNSKVLEIGSGCGIIPVIWCKKLEHISITAVEICESAFDILMKSIKFNGLEEKIVAINRDVRDLSSDKVFFGKFDMVVCNPPYYPTGGVFRSSVREVARCEVSLEIEEVVKLSHLFLKNKGSLCLCSRVERLSDVIFFMKCYKIEPKILRFVEYKEKKVPRLFLVEGKKGAKPGLLLKNSLTVELEDGRYSEEVSRIYGWNL